MTETEAAHNDTHKGFRELILVAAMLLSLPTVSSKMCKAKSEEVNAIKPLR